MKKTQRKDALRNITRQIVSYISIIVIALLGVTAFLGIGYSATALRANASAFYNSVDYRDIEIISTRLLTPEDIQTLSGIEGVADVEPVWQTQAKAYTETKQSYITIITLTERINQPMVVEGRLPGQPHECAIEQKLAEKMGWQIGETIDLEMMDATGGSLNGSEFVITGIVNHPDHGNLSLDEVSYLMITPENYSAEELQGCCVKAVLTIQKEADIDRFSSAYEESVKAVTDRIEAIIPERTAMRDAEVRAQVQVQIDVLNDVIREMQASRQPDETEDSEWILYLKEEVRALEQMDPTRWIMVDSRGNASYVQVITGSDNLASMEMTFSLLFILIGALVIYATVGKMVDEQRPLIGTMKALGFFSREIFAKYLLFGLSATLLGLGLGILTARFFLEQFVLNNYNAYYTFDVTRALMVPGPTLAVLAAGVLIAGGAIWTACRRLLRSPAVRLMQPPAPAGKKKEDHGRHVLSLYSRLILSNIRSDLRRVAVTVVSVAGCCALVVIGFTLKNGVEGSMRNQYPAISDYDARITFYLSVPEASEVFDRMGVAYVPLQDSFCTYRVTDLRTAELFCGDMEAIGAFYHLKDWQTGEAFANTDDGVLIPRRLAEIYSLHPGSELEISLHGVVTGKAVVAGIFENFIGAPIVLTPAYYQQIFGEECTYNATFVRFNGLDQHSVLERLEEDAYGYDEITPSDAGKAVFKSATSVINAIIALFIAMAAIMAGVVLLNLTNICIMQKKRELTIMRINGFTVREVIGYVTRETAATTMTGILLGIGAGAWIAYRIIRSMEQPFIQFERGVSVAAWLFGAAITILFAVIVNAVALRKVWRLKLTDMRA